MQVRLTKGCSTPAPPRACRNEPAGDCDFQTDGAVARDGYGGEVLARFGRDRDLLTSPHSFAERSKSREAGISGEGHGTVPSQISAFARRAPHPTSKRALSSDLQARAGAHRRAATLT